jgi:anti-sigma factor RsiW
MTGRCEQCRERVLDFLYGLLDPAEEAEVAAHIESCPACAAARDEAAGVKGLFAAAAKAPFPDVTFAAPAEASPPVPARKPSRTYPWAVAAALLVCSLALLSPAIRDYMAYREQSNKVAQAQKKLDEIEQADQDRVRVQSQLVADYDRRLVELRESHKKQVKTWVAADIAARAQPFNLEVTGPVAAIPGGLNEYAITTKTKQSADLAATATVTIRDSRNTVYHTETLPTNGKSWRLPTSLWAKFPAGAEDLSLAIKATTADGATAELTEPIQLLGPVFTTLVVTDKPLYRPGEPVYFRSLTLNRTSLQPPGRDLTIRFDLRKPDGTVLDGSTVIGTTTPVVNRDGIERPVVGPDGAPVRGIACGVIALPAALPGGEYTLVAHELPQGWAGKDLPAGSTPIGTRKVVVARYQPDVLLKTLEFDAKTYGPGDPVRAKVVVKNQGKPLANIPILVTATHGKNARIPVKAPVTLNADGAADISLTLPNLDDLKAATITVLIQDQNAESIVRPIPLASKTLSLEFFPEGGDLIEGLPNRVYVRATTATGSPADVEGFVTDGTNRVADVKTLTDAEHPGANQGLGVFAFTPQPGKRYALKLLRPVGTVEPKIDVPNFTTGYLLPKAEADGVVLTIPNGVIDATQPVKATVTSAKTKRNLIVGVYTRGFVVGHARLTAEPGKAVEVSIAPPPVAVGGVTRVTVFEEPAANNGRADLIPLAERLIFRRPAEKLNLAFATNHKGPAAPGDKVTLTVTATNEKDQPTAAVVMAAVVNQSVLTMADDKAERLLPTHFLLAGELQRPDQLEHADFILTPHPKAAAALDLLLGTQGWRRFAEADGRFRSSAASDAEKQRFWIANGRTDVMTESVRPDRVTASQRNGIEPIDAKLDQLEAEKKLAERERDRKLPEWDSQRVATTQAQAEQIRIGNQVSSRLAYGSIGIAVLLTAAWCYVLLSRKLFRVAAAVVVLSLGGILTYSLSVLPVPDDQWVESRLTDSPTVAEVDRGGTTDLRERGPTSPVPDVPATTQPQARPRSEIGPGSFRQARGEASASKLKPDRGERAARTFWDSREGSPTADEDAALGRVKQALTRHSPFVVREYAHPPKPTSDDATRTDFTETVLWHPVLVLPTDGRATLDFHVSDAVNPYRVLVAGHTLDGRLGAATGLLEVRKPLSADVKLPAELSSSDRPQLPVVVSNGTAKKFDAKVSVWSDNLIPERDDTPLSVEAAAGARLLAPVRVNGLGKAKVRVAASADALTDAAERTVTVVPDGFPQSGAANAELKYTAKATVTIPPDLVPKTLAVRLTVFTNALADIQSGLDGMLREPSGCFEQTSSTNYPNVLALEYLKDANLADPALASRARGLLESGYNRLAGFEVRKEAGGGREGFEWFGAFPAHECLTAYGLVQFTDMARVFPVDPQLIDRTRNFLLSRRDGKGGYARKQDGHAFGDVPPAVANAYITWAIHSADPTADLAKETAAVVAEALTSLDPYRLALTANVTPKPELLKALAAKQNPDGSFPGAEATITRSRGSDLVVETTALAALAFVNAKSPDHAVALGNAVSFLVKSRQPHGSFGGTQATVLALKAIVAYNRANRRPTETGEIVVKVDGKEVGRLPFKSDELKPTTLVFDNAEAVFAPGPHEVTLETTAKQSYPVNVSWEAFCKKLPSAADAPLKLSAALSAKEVVEGNSVRLIVQLQNPAATDTGMAVAVVGLPAGVKLPPDFKQLKDLTAKPAKGEATLSYWELHGRELILYWRALGPEQTIDLSLDLIADVPGEYHGPASRAYLYYAADAKRWLDPLTVTIRPAK